MNTNNFVPFPEIITENYLLRKLNNYDAEKIFEIRSNVEIAKYIDRPIAKSIDDVLQFIKLVDEGISKNEAIYWVITKKSDFAIVGTITLWQISEDGKCAEIGFELLPKYQSMGIMQEAIPKVIEFGFNVLQLNTILGEVDPENLKSIRLLKNFGFNLKSELKSTHIYSLEQ